MADRARRIRSHEAIDVARQSAFQHIARLARQEDVLALRDRRWRQHARQQDGNRHCHQRRKPGRRAHDRPPAENQHRRHQDQRIRIKAVDRHAERRNHQHQRRQAQPAAAAERHRSLGGLEEIEHGRGCSRRNDLRFRSHVNSNIAAGRRTKPSGQPADGGNAGCYRGQARPFYNGVADRPGCRPAAGLA